jgi:phage tail-like protein
MADFESYPPTTVHFSVKIDGGHDLGVFTACDGLGCEMVIEQREEGGNNAYIHQFAGRIKYSNVKLTRPINKDSAKVAAWFADLAVHKVERPTATIAALDPEGAAIASWKLQEVIPVRWQGPSFNVDGPKVATETLELAHHGFGPGAAQP